MCEISGHVLKSITKKYFNLLRSIDRHKQEVNGHEISRKEIISFAASLSLDSQKSRFSLIVSANLHFPLEFLRYRYYHIDGFHSDVIKL